MKTSIPRGLEALFPALCFAALLLLPPACDRLSPDITIRRKTTLARHEGGRTTARADSTAPVEIPPDGLFVTAVAYPDGYDWRRDTARGDVRGRLLLLRMRDTPAGLANAQAPFDTVLALDAGAGRAVSLDPDRHQFAGGHLYTQCLTEAGTVWKRDGQTFLLSREREYLRGILDIGDGFYMLVQRLSGEGFVLRRNSKLLQEWASGRLHGSLGDPASGRGGALFADGGQVCFSYEDGDGTWMLVRGREEQAVPLPRKMEHIFDLRCYDGQRYLVCRAADRKSPILFIDDRKEDWTAVIGTPAQLSGFHLYRSGGAVSVIGSLQLTYNQARYTARWQQGRLFDVRQGQCDWLDGNAWVQRQNGRIVGVHHAGTDYTLDGDGTLMMPACACATPDALLLALTRYGSTPALWVNGRTIPIALNGFLTSVSWLEQ